MKNIEENTDTEKKPDIIRFTLGYVLVACFALIALMLTACFASVDPVTGETVQKFDPATAQGYADTAQVALLASGQAGTPWGVIASGVLTLVSAGLGVATKVQSSKKNKVAETLVQTVSAAAHLLNDESKVVKLKDAAKEIQEQLGTRGVVKKNLPEADNLSKKLITNN